MDKGVVGGKFVSLETTGNDNCSGQTVFWLWLRPE